MKLRPETIMKSLFKLPNCLYVDKHLSWKIILKNFHLLKLSTQNLKIKTIKLSLCVCSNGINLIL